MSSKDKWYIPKVIKAVNDKIERNLNKVGVFLQAQVVQSFGSGGQAGSGGTQGKVHSSPGEPPYVQTGMLRRSITFTVKDAKTLLIGSSLQPQGSSHSYAWLLEMGSPGGQLEARPYLRPAVRNNKSMIMKLITS